ncbi:MAG: ABC transporter permease [Planctomycetota bacterium]|jgi:putative ABC transport system permease protein
MKFLPIVWRNIWRRKFRTSVALLSAFIAFVLFGILMTVRLAFTLGVDVAGLDRLILIHKVSLIMPLPIAYQTQLQAVPGVELATHQTWFGGVYQDPSNFFAQIVVEPEAHLTIYPEYVLPQDQIDAWLSDRQGAIAGRDLADRFGWEIGDRIPITATIWQPADGGQTWEFNLVGIYDGADGVDRTQFFFRYDYLDENRAGGQGAVGWFVVKIADASTSQEMARQFDGMFANSSAETETTTEKGFIEGFAKQIGDIGTIMVAILVAVLFNILLIIATVMAQSVRERTSEVGVLKTLGFSGPTILALVLAESMFIAALGGGVGLTVAWLIVQQGDPTGGMLPIFVMPPETLGLGLVMIVLMGLGAGLMPAIAAMNLKITDALRRS